LRRGKATFFQENEPKLFQEKDTKRFSGDLNINNLRFLRRREPNIFSGEADKTFSGEGNPNVFQEKDRNIFQ